MDEPARPATRVAPDLRLLFVLVVAVLLLVVAMVALRGRDAASQRSVALGQLDTLVAAMTSDPLPVAALDDIVVVRGALDPLATNPRWGEATGSLALDRREALFALSLRDPADGALLAWCRRSDQFEHPTTGRAYGRDGRLVAGRGPRGMDRRAIAVAAGGQVVIDPGRWVAGLPVRSVDAETRRPTERCEPPA